MDLNILSPPLTMTRDDVDFIVSTLRNAIELTMTDLRNEGVLPH
jgi:adenosylmethionine-8-amino-7-oxononanoate aminotransferase